MMLPLCLPFLLFLSWVTTQFCMEWYKAQVFIPWRSNSPTSFRWNLVETVTQHNAQYCPATCLRKEAAEILASPSSWGRSSHCPCEQVLINLISWVQSVWTAFVSWEVIHAQLPHFSGPLSSTLPLCWSFGKGIIFPGCSLLWTREGGAGTAATVWQMTLSNRLNKWWKLAMLQTSLTHFTFTSAEAPSFPPAAI